MPQYTAQIGPNGALLPTIVFVSTLRLAALLNANANVPNPVLANLQIDTGAAQTCLDNNVIQTLGLQATGLTLVGSATSGNNPSVILTYDASLSFTTVNGNQQLIVPALPILGLNLSAQGIDGLIGRDLLAAACMLYNGPTNGVLLSI
jgi:hypothetical protein